MTFPPAPFCYMPLEKSADVAFSAILTVAGSNAGRGKLIVAYARGARHTPAGSVKTFVRSCCAVVSLASCFLVACGGKAIDANSSAGGGTSTGGSPGAPSCLVIDASSYDQSCEQASDCTYVLTGKVCNGDCDCYNTLINVSDLARYKKAGVSSLDLRLCNCPDQHAPQCIDHRCR